MPLVGASTASVHWIVCSGAERPIRQSISPKGMAIETESKANFSSLVSSQSTSSVRSSGDRDRSSQRAASPLFLPPCPCRAASSTSKERAGLETASGFLLSLRCDAWSPIGRLIPARSLAFAIWNSLKLERRSRSSRLTHRFRGSSCFGADGDRVRTNFVTAHARWNSGASPYSTVSAKPDRYCDSGALAVPSRLQRLQHRL